MNAEGDGLSEEKGLIRLYGISYFFRFRGSWIDFDECALAKDDYSCDGNFLNVMGSHGCTCKPGFTGVGKTCQSMFLTKKANRHAITRVPTDCKE